MTVSALTPSKRSSRQNLKRKNPFKPVTSCRQFVRLSFAGAVFIPGTGPTGLSSHRLSRSRREGGHCDSGLRIQCFSCGVRRHGSSDPVFPVFSGTAGVAAPSASGKPGAIVTTATRAQNKPRIRFCKPVMDFLLKSVSSPSPATPIFL